MKISIEDAKALGINVYDSSMDILRLLVGRGISEATARTIADAIQATFIVRVVN